MKLELDAGSGLNLVKSVDAESIMIDETRYTRSLLLTPTEIDGDWGPDAFADLSEAHFGDLAAREPDIILLGCGPTQGFVDEALLMPLLMQGIGVEIMTTDAACRCYNVLVAEDRKVVAGLMLA